MEIRMHEASASNYYDHSNSRLGWYVAPLLALLAIGCGASNTQVARSARRVPVAHMADLTPDERTKALATLPVILEIRKGDKFPVEPALESSLLALHTEGTWTVEARETFYVLLREEGPPAVSVDGVDFDQPAQNSFGAGIDSQKGEPTKVRLALRWHAPAEKAK
jgi:hypothetical protein